MQLYIQASSKKEINERIATGATITGTEYNAFNPKGYMTEHDIKNVPLGTVIKVFSNYTPDGQPYAKAYGQVSKDKQGNLKIK